MKIRDDRFSAGHNVFSLALSLLALAAGGLLTAAPLAAAEAQWIWSPVRPAPGEPAGSCFFRKSFVADGATGGRIEITCDENYILYVNGVKIGSGDNWRSLDVYDLGPYLTAGRNVIGVAAVKSQPGPAGLAARVILDRQGGAPDSYSTGVTWKTNREEQSGWSQPGYNDSQWGSVRLLGTLGSAAPWGNQVQKPAAPSAKARFQVTREFRVEWVVPAKTTGSLLTMAFNEFGNILAARENGPLLLVRDTNADGIPDITSMARHYRLARTVWTAVNKAPAPQLLSGEDVMALLGLEPGPAVGRALDALEEEIEAGEVTDAEGARAFLQQWWREDQAGDA